ncbi:DUF354 domain-containing protein [Halorarius litoreus]|uniref:DUF354 domain-containing protein n=1 Tax=Halorarius litoreus TaxID=2962676 RepID=UPI0020CEA769|nr:DUF354 domain-containing protein [Halorarius litoreus]
MGGDRLRVLVDIQHPAQVHLFRNLIAELERQGHETLVTAREKEVTLELLDAYDIDYVSLSARRPGLVAALTELAVREVKMARLVRRFDPDVVVSRLNPPAVHAARLFGARSVVVKDTDIGGSALGRVLHATTLPFVDVLCVPPGLDLPVPAARTRTLAFQELAYLHPDRFTPDPDALAAYGVDVEAPYTVVRLAGWDAYHDAGDSGISRATLDELFAMLEAHGDVYVSSEADLPPEFADHALPVPVHLVHDLLAYADCYVGDSGTMSSEAALLGTPAVRITSVAGPDDEHIFRALEEEYDLLYSFSDERAALDRVRALLADGEAKREWQVKRDAAVDDWGDVTATMLSLVLEAGGIEEPTVGHVSTPRSLES